MMKNFCDLAFLFAGAFGGATSAFLLQFILARNVTPDILGNYSSILFLTTTISPLCGFGVAQYLLKVFGQYGWKGQLWVSPSLKFVFFSSLVVMILLISIAILGYQEQKLKIAALAMSSIALSEVVINIVSSVFQLEGKYKKLAIWQLLQNFFRFISVLLLIYILPFEINEKNIAFSYLIIVFFIILISIKPIIYLKNGTFKLIGHQHKNIPEKYKTISVFSVFKEAVPFGLAGLFYSIYYQLGVVFVRHYVDAEHAGYYSIAFTILTAAMVLPGVVYQKFLIPKLHRWAYHDREKFHQVYKFGNYVMFIIGLFTYGCIWFLSPILIPLIFGQAYFPSIEITQLLSLNIPIVYLASSVGATLVTGKHMYSKVKFMGVVALLNVILNIIFTPIFKLNGVILITLICNSILLILYYTKVRTSIFITHPY